MFGKLREKLKGWLKKSKEEVEEPEIVEKSEKKKEKKVKTPKDELSVSLPEKKKPVIQKELLQKVDDSQISKKEDRQSGALTIPPKAEENPIEKIEGEVFDSQDERAKLADKGGREGPKTSEEKRGFFSRFKKTLTNEKFDELFEELETILLQNNVAYSAVESIRESLAERLVGKNPKEVNLEEELKNSIEELLINPPDFIKTIKDSLKEKSPFVIVFAGINGSGKTTTIAKIANYLQKNKLSVCLAAADTFRAASIEQIQQHADKLGVHLTKKDYGSDPAAVGFDAVAYAKKHHIDIVLIDTAGRMQNKDSLMKEMEKIARINKPDMKIFLGESITGNDATEQAKAFNDAIGLTGIILSKADVDEKGGTAISVSYITKKPIMFLGMGQGYDDLEVFDKKKLVEKLGL